MDRKEILEQLRIATYREMKLRAQALRTERNEATAKEHEQARYHIRQAFDHYRTDTLGLRSFLDLVCETCEPRIGSQGMFTVYLDKVIELQAFFDELEKQEKSDGN